MDPVTAAYIFVTVVATAANNIFAAKKAKKAKQAAEANAQHFEAESAEKYRRTSVHMARQRGAAEAYSAASGLTTDGTAGAVQKANRTEQRRQLDWMEQATQSQARIIRQGGKDMASNIMGQAMAGWANAAGQAVASGGISTTTTNPDPETLMAVNTTGSYSPMKKKENYRSYT